MRIPGMVGRFMGSKVGRATSVAVAIAAGTGLVGLVFYCANRSSAASETPMSPGGTSALAMPDPGASGRTSSSATSVITVSRDKAAALGFQTVAARREEWPRRLRVTGRLGLNESKVAHVSSLVEGVVREVCVELGQRVEEGEILAYIDSREVGESKLQLVKHQLVLESAQKTHQWQKMIHDNTADLLDRLKAEEPASRIEKDFEDRPIGAHREQLVSASARLKRAAADYERIRALGENAVIPEKEVIRAEAEHESAQATYLALVEQIRFDSERQLLAAQQHLHEAEAAVAISRSQLVILGYGLADIDAMDPIAEGERVAYYPLRSPLGGTVIAKRAPVSKHVDAQTELFEIADLSTVWLRADVFEKDLSALYGLRGTTVRFRATSYPDREFTAELFSTGALVDDETRAAGLLAVAGNSEGLLKPGMFVQIELRGASDRGVLQVPASAVQRHGGASFVFVRTGGQEYERRDVGVGRSTAGVVEITDGLDEGEPVVVKGGFALKSEMLSELMVEE